MYVKIFRDVYKCCQDLISCLKNLSSLSSASEDFATVQKDLLREALIFLDSTESAVQVWRLILFKGDQLQNFMLS